MAAPLMRTYTAPVWQHSTDGVARLQSMGMSAAHSRQSQLSGSTAHGSTASLNSFASGSTIIGSPQNGVVVATGNIINQKADASRSLFQICVALRQRLDQVPDFEQYAGELEQYGENGEPIDPVETLWALLRRGTPLLTIYNATQPAVMLEVPPEADEEKRAKKATAKFMGASIKEFEFPAGDSFAIRDLMGNDTTGFVKVTHVINFVLDIAEKRGLLLKAQDYPQGEAALVGSQMSYRDHIVKELVDTERKYVQDLENLHDLKKSLEQKGAIPGDVIHNIFLNINPILDFQRKFLIRVETTNSQPRANQRWGIPFVQDEERFAIYEPFIANQRKAAALAAQVFEKIQTARHPVAVDFNTLDGFLLKPMQRLVKYPLLLKDMHKKSEDLMVKDDLSAGIEAAERVLSKANEAVDRDLLDEALDELINRVDDWKNHRVDQFGRLLLHGVYTVLTGKSDQEKDYEIYLFECILLCCKEVTPNKSKDKKDKTKSTGPKIRNKHAKLQLKGRIFMTNVTDVVSLSKPGAYTVQIFWKGDPGVENFVIKFQNEEMMKKWAQGLDMQRKENAPQSLVSPDQAAPEFIWNKSMGQIENPYAQQEDDDEEDQGPTPTLSQYGMPATTQSLAGAIQRTGSSTSLHRQRSATGESTQSLSGIARAPPPRFPLPQPPAPLSLQTQGSQGQNSPTPRGGDSYFSPVAESPTSSRTSTASFFPPSAGYPFPKAGTPQPGGWGPGDDQNRYTAPAVPRAPSRDGPSPANAYGMVGLNGRNPRGPSLPAMASQAAAAQLQQQRSRSYSTPDINGQPMNARRSNGPQVPDVPGIPAHLHPTHARHDSNIPRSHTSSPRIDTLPIRTDSPSLQRERQYGGQMAQFPTQPIYPRQGTPSNMASIASLPPPGPPPPGMAPLAPIDLSRTISPPLGTGSSAAFPSSATPSVDGMPLPTQLKVKVNCESGNYVTLVVAFNITYQSLIDRIDAKLARFTNSSIAKGNLKLRYRDEDGDFVTIEGDDDIQIAISEWREGVRNMYSGGVGEIELFCVGEMG